MKIACVSFIVATLVCSSLSLQSEELHILHLLDLEADDDHYDRNSNGGSETNPLEGSGEVHDSDSEMPVTTEEPTSESQITNVSYELLWVTKYREDGRVITASDKELANLAEEIRSQQSKRRVLSAESRFFDDGSGTLLENYGTIFEDKERQLDYLERLPCTRYPGNTLGLLSHGACSAFLVGPRHALTTAKCVFENGTWQEELDLYRGRDCSTYQDLMHWESVRVPEGYYSNGDTRLNWALITYTVETQSPVWTSISYDPSFSDRLVYLTVAGYCDAPSRSCLYSSECFSLAKSSLPWERNIEVECGAQIGFHGGPLIASENDYFSKRTGTRSVHGISTHTEQTNSHKMIRFTQNTFWQVCHFVAADGHDLHCTAMNQ